jgi:hypothetical protein
MPFFWLPSGMLKCYMTFNMWIKPKAQSKQFGNLDFSVTSFEEASPTKVGKTHRVRMLSAPHADFIFDNQSRAVIDRSKDGWYKFSIGPYEHNSILQPKLDWIMASAHYLKPEEGNFAKPSGLRMACDSGGAQLKFGTARYVDPHHVIDIYNKCADCGMSLDIPPKAGIDGFNTKALRILARIQKKNNEIFKAKRRPDLGLLNAIHGMKGDDIRRWIDDVIDPEFQGWAAAWDDLSQIESIYRTTAILYREYGLKENPQWVHLFGASGPKTIPIMAWMGRYIPFLTADSSSFLEGAKRRSYFMNQGGSLKIMSCTNDGKGKNFRESGFQESSILPCCCEICSLVRYFGVLSRNVEFPVSYPAIIGHNLIMIKQAADEWNTLATKLNLEEYVHLVGKYIGKDSAIFVRYADACFTDGPDYADKHFANFLVNGGASMHADAVDMRIKQQMTRVPMFSSTVGNGTDNIQGLGVQGSNLELIGGYLTPEELHSTLQEFGFDQALENLIKNKHLEPMTSTFESDMSLPLEE